MSRLHVMVLGAALALSACGQAAPVVAPDASYGPAPTGYQNQIWELETVDGSLFSPRPIRATAEFSRSDYIFSGPCNVGSGSYALGPGASINLVSGDVTALDCADPKDAAFFALVDEVTELRVTRAGLVLVTADGHELAFRPLS